MFQEKRNQIGSLSSITAAETAYKSFNLRNFKNIPQIKEKLSESQIMEMEVVGNVLPFKTNNYIIENLIDWDDPLNDPIFILTFPQKGMLSEKHFNDMYKTYKSSNNKTEIIKKSNQIRSELNPHPSGQIDYNIPVHNGKALTGAQHKYKETVLFFPKQGQTCHAYCTFCFRWPQFTGLDHIKFAIKEINPILEYIRSKPGITDILITGGDPMIMKATLLKEYIDAILNANISHLINIRIGTKALAYWPYKFTSDKDSDLLMKTFEKIRIAGKNLSIMAHFNHFKELQPQPVVNAVRRIRETGAQIRTQSPVIKYINDDPIVWEKMWKRQVHMNMVPYYMFMPRNTGAKEYFSVSLERAWEIFNNAYMKTSGLSRTVRGPVMSAGPGKILYLGSNLVDDKKVSALTFLQSRNPEWVNKPFFASYNSEATWIDELKPAYGDKFFYEEELEMIYRQKSLRLKSSSN